METNDQLRRRPVFLDAYGLQSQPGPERYAELEAAYRRALEIVRCGRYAEGDRGIAENVARHVIEIWKEEPSCNFLKLTNLAVHHYEVERARQQLFEMPAGEPRRSADARMPVPREMKGYRTAPRPKGATSGAVNPRPGEDPSRGGQKTYQDDPGGVEATDKNGRIEKESDARP